MADAGEHWTTVGKPCGTTIMVDSKGQEFIANANDVHDLAKMKGWKVKAATPPKEKEETKKKEK